MTNPNDIIIPAQLPTTVIVSGELVEKTAALLTRMDEHPDITDNATLQTMRALVKETSRLKTTVKAAQSVAIAPFEAIIAQIKKKAVEIINELDMVVTEGKRQEVDFLTERDRLLALEAERFRQQEIVARLDTSRPTPALTVLPVAETVDAPISSRPDIKVIDESLIPASYRDINWVRVRADVMAGKIVPGVEKIMVTVVTAR